MSQNQPGERTSQEVLRDVVIPQLGKNMSTEANNWQGSGILKTEYVSSPTEKIVWVRITTAHNEVVTLLAVDPADGFWHGTEGGDRQDRRS